MHSAKELIGELFDNAPKALVALSAAAAACTSLPPTPTETPVPTATQTATATPAPTVTRSSLRLVATLEPSAIAPETAKPAPASEFPQRASFAEIMVVKLPYSELVLYRAFGKQRVLQDITIDGDRMLFAEGYLVNLRPGIYIDVNTPEHPGNPDFLVEVAEDFTTVTQQGNAAFDEATADYLKELAGLERQKGGWRIMKPKLRLVKTGVKGGAKYEIFQIDGTEMQIVLFRDEAAGECMLHTGPIIFRGCGALEGVYNTMLEGAADDFVISRPPSEERMNAFAKWNAMMNDARQKDMPMHRRRKQIYEGALAARYNGFKNSYHASDSTYIPRSSWKMPRRL